MCLLLRLIIFGLIVLFPGVHLKSQSPALRYALYTTSQGLCDNNVQKTMVDKRGFLWVVTTGGLSRFDGVKFTNYYGSQNTPGALRSSWVTDVAMDSLGTVWVSTEWGVCWYDYQKNLFHYVNPFNKIAVFQKAPMIVSGNNLWVATSGGLWKINVVSKAYFPTKITELKDPYSLIADEKGKLLITTRGYGIILYDTVANAYRNVETPQLRPRSHILEMAVDKEGVWAATEFGLLLINSNYETQLFDAVDQKILRHDFLQLVSITESPFHSHEWICGTYDGSIMRFDKAKRIFINQERNYQAEVPGKFSSVFNINNSGDKLWISTAAGLLQLDIHNQPVKQQLLLTTTAKSGNPIKGFAPSRKDSLVWISTFFPASLNLIKLPGNEIVQSIPSTSKSWYFSIDNLKGYLWVSKNSGIQQHSLDGKLLRSYETLWAPWSFSAGEGLYVYAATANGFSKINSATGQMINYTIQPPKPALENANEVGTVSARRIIVDTINKKVWIGTMKYGLFEYDMLSGACVLHSQNSTLPYNATNRIAEMTVGAKSTLWLGTMNGLIEYNMRSGALRCFTPKARQQPNYIYDMDTDEDGRLWIRSNEGVYVKKHSEDKFSFIQLPPFASFNMVEQPIFTWKNQAVLGLMGETILLSLPEKRNTSPFQLYITECNTAKSEHYLFTKDSTLRIAKEEDFINVSFAAPYFTNSSGVRYFYRVKGLFNKMAAAPLSREINISNLQAGTYTLEVMAENDQGQTAYATLGLQIVPPYYQTWWFFAIILVLISLLVFYAYRFRISQIKKQQQIKQDIRRNLHDELGATLSSMAIYSNMGKIKTSEEGTANTFEKILANTMSMQESIAEMIWYINPKIETLGDILLKIQDYALPLFESVDADCKFDWNVNEKLKVSISQKEHIYLLFKEAINNSVKYSGAKNIVISLNQHGQFLEGMVQDDGKGFDTKVVKSGNGLTNMQERVRRLNGNLQIISEPGHGTTITFQFKIPKISYWTT